MIRECNKAHKKQNAKNMCGKWDGRTEEKRNKCGWYRSIQFYRILLSREESVLLQWLDIHESHVPAAVPAWWLLSNEGLAFSAEVGKTSMPFSLILVSPRSTSRLALWYIQRPTNVSIIPMDWAKETCWPNQMMLMTITKIRFTSDAMEYVTGDVMLRVVNANQFWPKLVVPLSKKYMISRVLDTDVSPLVTSAAPSE